jgi:hypothetical protein
MHIDIPPRPEIGSTDLLCINRKIHDSPIKPRQSAFVDRFMQGATVAGCPGHLVSYHEAKQYPTTNPWHIRGMKFTAAINDCWRDGRTFYYTDNGYVGNGQQKVFFRIIENHVHDIRSIIERPRDRLSASPFPVVLKNFTPGRKLLIAPPSEKSLSLWGMNPEVWVAEVVEELKKYTDRPIEIRLKRPRGERMAENTMEQALADDVHCLITYNSVAACEAVMLGKPAITLGPNAAGVLCSNTLSEIENPKIPSYDEREAWLRHLSYSQFTFMEMADGTAWRILNER